MIDLKVVGNSFEKTFLNSFIRNKKEEIVLPEQTRKNMCKKLTSELQDLNTKYGIEGYGHILYLISEAKSVQKNKNGYVIAVEEKTYNSYIFLDRNLDLDMSNIFFFRNHISSNKKNAILFNNNKIFSFSQSNDNLVFNIEEKETKEKTLSYSSNFSSISLKTTEFSINTYSLNKMENYNFNIKDGNIRKKDNAIIISFNYGQIEKNILSNLIEFKINKANVNSFFSLSNKENTNEIIYSYDPYNKDISISYPVEYKMKNKIEDIKEFFDVLSLLSDNSHLPNASIYLSNISFFEDFFNTLESCQDITNIIASKTKYDIIFKKFEDLNEEVEKSISLLNSNKFKI